MKTIQQILAVGNMLGSIQAIKSGVTSPFDPAFETVTRGISGDSGTYVRIEGGRETARLVQYGAPSVRRNLRGLSTVPVKLAHSFEHQFHDPIVLQNLMQYDNPSVQELGIQEIGRQTGEFKALFVNLRRSAIASTLALGAIYFDADGNLLPSATGAVVTINFQMAAGNQGQINWDNTGQIITASWATAGTDIVGQVEAIKLAAMKLTGYPLTTAYYGEAVPSYIMGNTVIGSLAVGNPAYAQAFLQNTIPDGMLGLKWRAAGSAMFVDQNGARQEIWPADRVTFTPDPSRDWYEMLEGSYPVPTDIGAVTSDALTSAQANIRIARGMFNYAHVLSDPVTVKHLAGDTMLPVLKVPNAIFQADVVP